MEGNHTLFAQGVNTDQLVIAMQVLHGLEGPPEKKTNVTEAKTQPIDKWAQRTAQWKKGKVGGPSWVAGRPPWLADVAAPPDINRLKCANHYQNDN